MRVKAIIDIRWLKWTALIWSPDSSRGDAITAARAMSRIWRKDSVRRSPEAMRLAVHIFQSSGDMAKLAETLPAYLRLRPDDWQSWLSLAALESLRGRADDALAAMEKAVTYGGDKVLPVIEKSQTLLPVFEQFVRRRRSSPQRAPGAGLPVPLR